MPILTLYMHLILSLITLQVCVADGTTTLVQLEDMIPSSNILIQPTNEEALSALLAGDCNTIYAGTNEVAEAVKENDKPRRVSRNR